MKKKIRIKNKKKTRHNTMHASRMLNANMSLETFASNRLQLESSLQNVFSKFEHENDSNKQVVFY